MLKATNLCNIVACVPTQSSVTIAESSSTLLVTGSTYSSNPMQMKNIIIDEKTNKQNNLY